MFPTLGFAATQPVVRPEQVKRPEGTTAGKVQSVSVQAFLKASGAAASPFAGDNGDALAEAAMLWIPSGVVRSESWLLNKESDVLTTVHTCCGKQCRSEKRWRQFGRAAELLEHLAEEEQFRFLPCPAPGCDEWHWDCRLLDHVRHAHQDRVAVVQQRLSAQRKKKSTGKKAVASGRKAKRLAEAKAASSAASDSGVSVTTSFSSVSPAVARKSAATPSVAELRKKVLAWDASTMAERSKPLVVKKHFCSHTACNLSKWSFKSVAAVQDHIADVHSHVADAHSQ